MEEEGYEESTLSSVIKLPLPRTRPSSMVVKRVCPREFIPPHILAEVISTLDGLGLRWSGPITPAERHYVEQYVLAKYPQYSHGLIEEDSNLCSICFASAATSPSPLSDSRRSSSPSPSIHPGLDGTQLEPSRLLDILEKKSSFLGSFISIPEIQARNRALQHCGLADDDYLTLFLPTHKDAMMLVGESYPFFRHNYYLTVIHKDLDCIREFAAFKESKVMPAPAEWLDLRIKGSQLSQHFRRKSKFRPKGLFAYPAEVMGARFSTHWVSEAHRNAWHVLLDVTGAGRERLSLALHRPDFVLCTLDGAYGSPYKIICLLVRRKSFDTSDSG